MCPQSGAEMPKSPLTVASAEEPEDFAREIARWLDDEEGRKRMGQEARQWVAEAFDWTTATATLVALLRNHARKGDSA